MEKKCDKRSCIITKWFFGLNFISSQYLFFLLFIAAKCGFTNVIKLPFNSLSLSLTLICMFLISIACCEFPTQKYSLNISILHINALSESKTMFYFHFTIYKKKNIHLTFFLSIYLQHAIATDMLDDADSMWNYTNFQDVCRVVYAWIVDMIQLVVTVTIVRKAFIVIQVKLYHTKRRVDVSRFFFVL